MDIYFLGDNEKNRQAIGFAKTEGKMAFFCKSYENVLISVFLHADFISALKIEPNSMIFEKYAKNGKKKLSSLFSIFCDFL